MSRIYGLTGYPLGHSWSKKYFDNKFRQENIEDTLYELFPCKIVSDIKLLPFYHKALAGLNVTIPHKTSVIPILDELDRTALEINAVNTIKINRGGNAITMQGYNTDAYGFEKSIKPLLGSHHKAALILGTGGAAKAAAWVFRKNGIDFKFVSRNPGFKNELSYQDLTNDLFEKYSIIVNATPLGMVPDNHTFPPLPYHQIGVHHLLFDMVYNPTLTPFLKKGSNEGATVKNGLEMLYLQAEKAWEIWNS